ncbi:MAG TPA: glycosyltransferase family 4 protein [Bdellovibrionales bacterium]|nr:glycosyltransferase family 4 protein [Bdellovibrionales bacterium]
MAKQALPERLNICFVSKKFPILGRASEYGFLWPIARGLASRGHKVTVLAAESPRKLQEITQDGVHALYLKEGLPQHELTNFGRLAKNHFVKLHRQEPFHIVHSIDDSGSLIARFKREYDVAVAFDVQATHMSQIFAITAMAQETVGSLLRSAIAVSYKFLRTYYGTDRKLLKSADGVFVTSPRQRTVLERYYLYPDARIYTVPYGIEIGDLSPKEKSMQLRETLKLPENARIAVTVSDMTEVREMANLLQAFEKVAIKNSLARLLVIGNGPKRKEIEFEMLNLALGNRVIFTGAVKNTEVPDYISLADVYVNISSRATGFELSMLEAMAQKKVIIGSEVSPISSIVEDRVDGFLIRPADVSSLSALLNEVFSGQLPTQEIGNRARLKITDLFDTQKMVNQTLNSYFKILKSTGKYKK